MKWSVQYQLVCDGSEDPNGGICDVWSDLDFTKKQVLANCKRLGWLVTKSKVYCPTCRFRHQLAKQNKKKQSKE